MPYLTPDSAPSGRVCRTISIPDDWQWLSLVGGALSELTKVYNFEKFGSLTPEETAEFFTDLLADFQTSKCMVIPIGMFGDFGQADGQPPDKWLWCDGSAISRTIYAELFAVIGVAYGAGNGTTTFNLPDFRGLFPLGTVTQNPAVVGATGGQANVTLTVANLPAHHHTQRMRNGNNMLLAGGSTNRVSITSTTEFNLTSVVETGDTGGGTSHENMPPYMTVLRCIYAGV